MQLEDYKKLPLLERHLFKTGLEGNQKPAVEVGEDYEATLGPQVLDFTDAFFGDLYEYQADLTNRFNAYDPKTKKWLYSVILEHAPRRNGKTEGGKRTGVYRSAILGHKGLWTAHLATTALATFTEIKDVLINNPELNRLVKHIRNGNGQQEICFKSGGSIKFMTRTKNQARGQGFDYLIIDESQDLSAIEWQALQPTVAAPPKARSGQIILMGTPPNAMSEGQFLIDLRARIIARKPEGMYLAEWSATKNEDGSYVSDLQEWANANPALGFHLDLDELKESFETYDANGFARERLGVWGTTAIGTVVPEDVFETLIDPESTPMTDLSLAIDVNYERSFASVAVAGIRADGLCHIEIIEAKAGVDWVVPFVAEQMKIHPFKALVFDSRSGAAAFNDDFRRLRIRTTQTTVFDLAIANSKFYDSVMQGELRHIGQPHLQLSLMNAAKRDIPGGWALKPKANGKDITGIVACVLALWATTTTKRTAAPVRIEKKRKKQAPLLV